MKETTFQIYKNWHLNFRTCIPSEPPNVKKNAVNHLDAGEIYMMFYDAVIMHSG